MQDKIKIHTEEDFEGMRKADELFLENKYSKSYFKIIESARAKNRIKGNGEYFENHHLIPKFAGGNNSKDNLILLTGKEHFICHHLLTKMTSGKLRTKSIRSWIFLSRKIRYKNMKINANTYEEFKKLDAQEKSRQITEQNLSNNPMKKEENRNKNNRHRKNKTWEEIFGPEKAKEMRMQVSGPNSHNHGRLVSDKERRNISQKMLGERNPMFGKTQSLETIEKIRQGNLNKKRSIETRKRMSEARKDKIIYRWYHSHYLIEECTRSDLISKYKELNLNTSELGQLISGKRNIHKGWKFLQQIEQQ
jgi:NUMOD3 motif